MGLADTELKRHPTPDLKAYSSLAFPDLVSTGSSMPSFQALDTEKGRGDVQGPHENASRTCWWLGSLQTGLLFSEIFPLQPSRKLHMKRKERAIAPLVEAAGGLLQSSPPQAFRLPGTACLTRESP